MLKQISKHNAIKIINSYIKKSPFYQNKYGVQKIDEFDAIPFLTKQELLEDQKIYSPYGSNLCCNEDKIIRVHRTSGTTSRPLLIALTKKDIDIVTTIGTNLFRLVGMSKKDTVINCLNYNMWMGGYTDHQSMEKTGAAIIPYGIGNTDNLISLIRTFKSCSIHCTPSYLSVLKNKLDILHIEPHSLNIKNGFFAAEGGLQNDAFRKKIEDDWGMQAYNANYGLSEVISILGSECTNKNGLHFGATEVLYLELLDENSNTIDIIDGAKGELVITHLKKEAQPLVRYKTGDILEIVSLEKCQCGFSGFRFKIIGRTDDMLVIKGINFFPESLRNIFNTYQELSGLYQVFASKQDPVSSIKILIETKGNIDNLTNIKNEIIKDIKTQLNISPELEFTQKIEFIGNKIKLLERLSDV